MDITSMTPRDGACNGKTEPGSALFPGFRESSTLKKGWNTCSCSSVGMPGPLSEMVSATPCGPEER